MTPQEKQGQTQNAGRASGGLGAPVFVPSLLLSEATSPGSLGLLDLPRHSWLRSHTQLPGCGFLKLVRPTVLIAHPPLALGWPLGNAHTCPVVTKGPTPALRLLGAPSQRLAWAIDTMVLAHARRPEAATLRAPLSLWPLHVAVIISAVHPAFPAPPASTGVALGCVSRNLTART